MARILIIDDDEAFRADVRKEQIDTDGDVYPGSEAGRTERDRTR